MTINDSSDSHEHDRNNSTPSTESPLPPALLHRSLHTRPYTVTSARGITLTLSDNRTIIDACAGAAVACIGHGNDEVLAAITRQMSSGVSYLHSLIYTTDAAEGLASHLIDGPQGARRFGLERVYLVSSGSEAMDAALKLARQYWFEQGVCRGKKDQTNEDDSSRTRTRYVSRLQSYHGTTIGAMNVSSNLPRKAPYANLQLGNISWVSPAYMYQYSRWQQGETEEEFGRRLVEELERHFLELGPETVIAFVAETLVGATSACTPAPKGYFRGVREVCDRYGILLILDEIMSGMGRTGTQFAFEQEGIVPDIVAVGKGLGGGYAPVGGVLVHKKIVDVLRKGTSSFNHGHTYQAHPVGCAAALAVQTILRRDGLIDNCAKMGEILHNLLVEAFGAAKYVGDIRGRGLFWSLEFVEDRKTRQSFDPKVGFGPRFQAMAFENGVAVYPGAGTVDGTRGDHAIVSPPYNVTPEELKQIVDVMKTTYDNLEKEIDDAGTANTS
jgi:adenosylmethionine-8-amino-7-oxononanoate aminotransferase